MTFSTCLLGRVGSTLCLQHFFLGGVIDYTVSAGLVFLVPVPYSYSYLVLVLLLVLVPAPSAGVLPIRSPQPSYQPNRVSRRT